MSDRSSTSGLTSPDAPAPGVDPPSDMHPGRLNGGGLSPPTERALAALRAGLGIIWVLNLLFILDPANEFFSGFSSTAASYAPTTLGGPAVPNLVSQYPMIFAVAIFAVTAYLAVAFLVGLTTRLACLAGLAFNSILLLTQYGQIVVIPGGTDIGPQPLYLLIYGALLVVGGRTAWSVDAWLTARGGVRAVMARFTGGGKAHDPEVTAPSSATLNEPRTRNPSYLESRTVPAPPIRGRGGDLPASVAVSGVLSKESV